MKKERFYNILLIVGIALVVISLGILLISQLSQRGASKRARELVVQLRQLMPQTYPGVLDDRSNVIMPSMEIEGESFCGIIEIPAYNADLPICDVWNASTVGKYPCRYIGSVYDGSLVIGGSDNAGQFDFLKQITGGDRVYVTDMTGARYAYTVSDVFRTSDVSTEHLTGQEGDLVLYAKNSFSLDYTLVICKIG